MLTHSFPYDFEQTHWLKNSIFLATYEIEKATCHAKKEGEEEDDDEKQNMEICFEFDVLLHLFL